jgi:predicted  nucleic acid-binding Zn-ribbon protein
MLAVEDKISSSSIYQNIKNGLDVLEQIQNLENLSTEDLTKVNHLILVFTNFKIRLDIADPVFVSNSTLTNMYNSANNIVGELNSFKSNRNTAHLNNVVTNVETLLTYFPQINLPQNEQEIEGIREYVVKFRQSVGHHLSNLENEFERVESAHKTNSNKLNELTTQIDNQKSRVDTVINDFQTQFSQAQKQRMDDFSDEKKERENSYEENEKARETRFKEIVNDQSNKFDDLTKELNGNVDKIIMELNTLKAKAEEIVTIITNSGLAGAYHETAKSEKAAARWWHIGSLSALVLLLAYGYFYLLEGDFSLTGFFARLVIAGAGGTLFGYCAKQASNHRLEERRNRQIALEFASLDPFIGRFSDEDQQDIKTKLVEKYFGKDVFINTSNSQQQTQAVNNAVPLDLNNPQILQVLTSLIQKELKDKNIG